MYYECIILCIINVLSMYHVWYRFPLHFMTDVNIVMAYFCAMLLSTANLKEKKN